MSNFIELKNLSKTFFDKNNINVLKKIKFKFQLGNFSLIIIFLYYLSLNLCSCSGVASF